jgi:hypothetical protein
MASPVIGVDFGRKVEAPVLTGIPDPARRETIFYNRNAQNSLPAGWRLTE